jgi:hypothetical protein
MGAAEFFNSGPQAGTDGEEAADGRKCDGDPAVFHAGRLVMQQAGLENHGRSAVPASVA